MLLLASCSRDLYSDRNEIILSQSYTASSFRPSFERELYRAVIDGKIGLKKFHFSGLLYLKNFSDTATRVVFQNEMGSTFFDFAWDSRDSFAVQSIIPQMNQAALVKTLRKDFELLLVKNIAERPQHIFNFFKSTEENFITFNMDKGYAFYVVNRNRKLVRIEHGDDKQRVVIMKLNAPGTHTLADKIFIDHRKAGFSIDLKKIPADAAE